MSKILLPLYLDENGKDSILDDMILYTRFEHDFQEDCFLFHETRKCTISQEEAKKLSKKYQLC